jgi:hypothetical protein
MKIRNSLAAIAAFGLITAPIAASANTRAESSVSMVSPTSLKLDKRVSSPVSSSEQAVGSPWPLLIGGFVVFTGVLIWLVDKKRSRGA